MKKIIYLLPNISSLLKFILYFITTTTHTKINAILEEIQKFPKDGNHVEIDVRILICGLLIFFNLYSK